MSYRGLKIAVGLVLVLCCGAACGASGPGLPAVREPTVSLPPWGRFDAVAFSPDGKYLAVTGKPRQSMGIGVHKGASVACWRVADWKRVACLRIDAFYRGDKRNCATAERLAWTPDSTRLVIYDTRNIEHGFTEQGLTERGLQDVLKARISVWNRDGWRLVSSANVSEYASDLVISPDGGSYVSLTNDDPNDLQSYQVNVWDLRMGSLRFSAHVKVHPTERSPERRSVASCAAYSSDGKWLAASQGDIVCLINVATRAVVSRRLMSDMIYKIRFQPDTQKILVGYGDSSYQLLGAPALTPVTSPAKSGFGFVYDVQFASTGHWFVTASSFSVSDPGGDMVSKFRQVVTLVETASLKVFEKIGPVKTDAAYLALSPDGSKIVLAVAGTKFIDGDDGRLVIFPTSKPGGPSPDAWLKAHPGSTRQAAVKPPLPPKTPSGAPSTAPAPMQAPTPAPTPAPALAP